MNTFQEICKKDAAFLRTLLYALLLFESGNN